jgi:predicted aconitase/predicted aconitase with swiveling domain
VTGNKKTEPILFVENEAKGQIFTCSESLSFWGGVDPNTGKIIDSHHPNHGSSLTGKIVLMPSSRGSCSGSGVLLQLARNNIAPAAIVFTEAEEILTLGAIIATKLFDSPVAILRLPAKIYEELSAASFAEIKHDTLEFSNKSIPLIRPNTHLIQQTNADRNMIVGRKGLAAKIAMEVICVMASVQDTNELIDVSRAHIDGCILAHDANLDFAEKMFDMGAKTCIPTTINAISVDRENWRSHGLLPEFGLKASRLADAYVKMGARPTFTCAPYLLDDTPGYDEAIGWSESNAVIFANSVLGSRTQKHPDYFDLFIAITGRAPKTGVYLPENRIPAYEICVQVPDYIDDAFWPMLGWLAGAKSPVEIPILTGLEKLSPTHDDLKALCAAFGTTSGAAMIHVRGHTPECPNKISADTELIEITKPDFIDLWCKFNSGEAQIDLVAIGSPHASISECRAFADLLDDNSCFSKTQTIITVGRNTLNELIKTGIASRLERSGVRVIPDICWCSITEPIFPKNASVLMTNSGKYAHYGKGLSGREVRFGSLKNCATAAVSGRASFGLPTWLL